MKTISRSRLRRLLSEPLLRGQNPVKFTGNKSWESGDIIFQIYHVASRDCLYKGLCDFMGKSHSFKSPSYHV